MYSMSRLAALTAMLVLMVAGAAQAATYNVTTTVDEEPANPANCPPDAVAPGCSLREAVFVANDSPANDTINVPAGEYVLPNDEDDADGDADLDIDARNNADAFAGTLAIVGNSARDTTIRSGGTDPASNLIQSRILDLEGGSVFDPAGSDTCREVPGANLELRNVRITRGFEDNDVGGGILVRDGGGDCDGDLDNTDFDGRLTVRESAITNNLSEEDGGGIYSDGEVALFNSLVASNGTRPGAGGGIDSNDSLSMVNTTIAGNQAGGQFGGRGGGLSLGDQSIEEAPFGDERTGVTDALNVTIASNDAGTGGGGVDLEGPRESDAPPLFTVKNTIIADNTAGQGGINCNSGALLVSRGNNLENHDTCGFDAPGDLTNTSSGLLGRANNGGPTDTMALSAASPAIDAGNNDGCPETDQRFVTRPQGARCDIGAYEFVPPPPGEPTPPTVIRETVFVPTAFPRVSPRGLTLRVRKDRPTTRSLRLRSRGRVLLPAGLTRAQACTFGVVAIQVKANGKTVSTRLASLRRDCTYRSRVTFNALRRIRGRILTVRARFSGNDRLRTKFSPKRTSGRG